MKKKYKLQISCRVMGEYENGGFSGDTLEVSETVTIQAKDFLELCQSLAKFHELAEKFRKEG